jgi:hypothetical protein
MKKIINGKMYDTEKAKLMAEWDNKKQGSLEYVHEALYQKRTGEFFVYGTGGPKSQYAKPCGNDSWDEGNRIMPLTYDGARQWAKEHLTEDECIEIFPEVFNHDIKQSLHIVVKVETYEKLKRMASEQELPIGKIIDNLVN